MRCVAISDTHGLHRKLSVPDGDLLLVTGDITNRGMLSEVEDFDRFLGGLPHRCKVVIAGNHDFCFEREPEEARAALTEAIYLCDESYRFEALTIYGSPWQPKFCDWAFNLPRGEALAQKWAAIPADTDILLTHGPPAGVLDRTHHGREVGCADLSLRLREISVRVHLFGHIHEAYGRLTAPWGTDSYNASVYDHFQRRLNPPWVFDLD